jgi:hypothetical protein
MSIRPPMLKPEVTTLNVANVAQPRPEGLDGWVVRSGKSSPTAIAGLHEDCPPQNAIKAEMKQTEDCDK